MKKTRLLTILLMAMAVSLGCTSCTEKEGEDDTGIEVNLRNANNGGGMVTVLSWEFLGGTWGGTELEIDKSDNFYVSQNDAAIVSVGQVSGLSKVNNFPSSGWSRQALVKKGNGYVIRGKAKDGTYRYARVYVIDLMTGASSGGVIGATIRYEPDWI